MTINDIVRYLEQLQYDMKISEISIVEKITGTANSTIFTFIVEGNPKFQLKVTKK